MVTLSQPCTLAAPVSAPELPSRLAVRADGTAVPLTAVPPAAPARAAAGSAASTAATTAAAASPASGALEGAQPDGPRTNPRICGTFLGFGHGSGSAFALVSPGSWP